MLDGDIPYLSAHEASEDLLARLQTTSTKMPIGSILVRLLLQIKRHREGLTLRPVGTYITPEITEKVSGSFLKAASSGSSQLLSSYARGDWDTSDLYQLLSSLWRLEQLTRKFRLAIWPFDAVRYRMPRKREADHAQIPLHYDLPMSIFEAFLDPGLAYSATQIRDQAESYRPAYKDSYDRIIRSLVGDREEALIADLGCGWGAFTRHVLQDTGHSVYAITISRTQAAYARQHLSEYLSQRLTVIEGDFTRSACLPARADAIVMIETIEHLDPRARAALFRMIGQKYPDARLFLQFTATPNWTALQKSARPTAGNSIIFPGPTELPTIREILRLAGNVGYRVINLDELTSEYSSITLAWKSRFGSQMEQLSKSHPTALLRAWEFYLTGLTTALGQRALLSYQVTLARS
jgi:cyclopropane-fatty-acyl-phospholipid synthase